MLHYFPSFRVHREAERAGSDGFADVRPGLFHAGHLGRPARGAVGAGLSEVPKRKGLQMQI